MQLPTPTPAPTVIEETRGEVETHQEKKDWEGKDIEVEAEVWLGAGVDGKAKNKSVM